MKLTLSILLMVAWCAAWFCGCGGSTSVDISNSNQQEQNQAQDEADIQNAQDACAYCIETTGPGESLAQCVTEQGFDISEC